MPTKAENLKRIKDAFVALDRAERDVEALGDPMMVETLPANRPIHIPGTRYVLTSNGRVVSVDKQDLELSIDDLGAAP